jgi:hypothetical protein
VVLDNRKTHTNISSEWELIKHGVPQGSVLGPLFFLLYVNDLPDITTNNAKIVLYADDTSIIMPNPSLQELETNMNKQFIAINEWFKANLLSLNFKKPRYLLFRTKNSSETNISICCGNKHITNRSNIKFLGLHIDKMLSWKLHIDKLVTMSKMSSACYAVMTVKGLMSQETLKIIYFAYVHSIMEYGIIFWGNSPNSINVFRVQKRISRVIMNAKTRDSVRTYLKT